MERPAPLVTLVLGLKLVELSSVTFMGSKPLSIYGYLLPQGADAIVACFVSSWPVITEQIVRACTV